MTILDEFSEQLELVKYQLELKYPLTYQSTNFYSDRLI